MASKRDYSQVASPGSDQGSPGPDSNDGFKKRKFNAKTKHRPNEGSSEWAKKRSRTIDRLLKRNQELPANVRNDLERELAALKSTVSDKAFQRKRSAMISKYHMVRFFERKKAARLVKQLRKKIEQATSPEEIEELKKDLHTAEVDEAYTQHHPHAETYISLYPNSKSEAATSVEDDEKTAAAKVLLKAPRPPMWSTVEQAVKGGPDALRRLRERRSQVDSLPKTQSERKPQKSKPAENARKSATANAPEKEETQEKQQVKEKAVQQKKGEPQGGLNRRERRRQMRETMEAAAVENDSDGGGFFEED
ncbi:Fc.00g111700.m01.CDS01 [Cosmosporella sp. VM-42]